LKCNTKITRPFLLTFDIIPFKEDKYAIIYSGYYYSSGLFFTYLFEEIQPIQLLLTIGEKYKSIKCNTDSDLSNRFYCVYVPKNSGSNFTATWLQINDNFIEDRQSFYICEGGYKTSSNSIVPLRHRNFLYAFSTPTNNEVSIIIVDKQPKIVEQISDFYCEIIPPFYFGQVYDEFNPNRMSKIFTILSNNTLVIPIKSQESWILKTKDISQILKRVQDGLEYPYYQIIPKNNSKIN